VYQVYRTGNQVTEYSRGLNSVYFPVRESLQQKLCRWKILDVNHMKCVLLDCWDQISQVTINEVIDQLLKIWPWWLDHRMDMLSFVSTRMYTTLALIVNFKYNVCKNWTSSLKFIVILAQCCYTEIAQRILKCNDMRHTNLTPDKELNSLMYKTFSVSTCTGVTNLILKTVRFLAHPVVCQSQKV